MTETGYDAKTRNAMDELVKAVNAGQAEAASNDQATRDSEARISAETDKIDSYVRGRIGAKEGESTPLALDRYAGLPEPESANPVSKEELCEAAFNLTSAISYLREEVDTKVQGVSASSKEAFFSNLTNMGGAEDLCPSQYGKSAPAIQR